VNIHEHRVLDFCDPCDGTHAIDVALHEMPTEAVACPERPFQVDAPALFPLAINVRPSVVPTACTVKAPLRTFSTVRQAPLTAMLSPFFTPLYDAFTRSSTPLFTCTASILPSASTIR